MARVQEVMAQGGDYHVEYRLAGAGGGERWVEGKGRMVLDDQGRPLRMTGVCMDISERKQAERRLELALQELRHRVKNMLAVVQSLASQTLRHGGSLEAFAKAFQGRLVGLAGAHDLLVDTNWAETGLRALVVAQLAPFLERQDQLKLAGEDVMLPANAVLTLGMTLHELATNAAKYGALSSDAGTVEVVWRQEPTVEGPQVVLCWQERGGPQGFAARAAQLWHPADRGRHRPRARRRGGTRVRPGRRTLRAPLPQARRLTAAGILTRGHGDAIYAINPGSE